MVLGNRARDTEAERGEYDGFEVGEEWAHDLIPNASPTSEMVMQMANARGMYAKL